MPHSVGWGVLVVGGEWIIFRLAITPITKRFHKKRKLMITLEISITFGTDEAGRFWVLRLCCCYLSVFRGSVALLLTHIQEIVYCGLVHSVNESHIPFTNAAYLSNIAREVYASLSEILDGFP